MKITSICISAARIGIQCKVQVVPSCQFLQMPAGRAMPNRSGRQG